MGDRTDDDAVTEALVEHQLRATCGESSDPVSAAEAVQVPQDLQDRLARGKACIDLLLAVRREVSDCRNGTTPSAQISRSKTVARFQVQEELGSGGFGIVYRAFDPLTGRDVALKIPRIEVLGSASLRERFEHEAKAAARLNNANIVTVLEAGTDGAIPYIASQFFSGMTLATWLAQQQIPAAPLLAAQWIADLAGGVEHAHSRGVLHRDIKPSNVFLARPDSDHGLGDEALVPKLMDFGLAKLAMSQRDLTQTGAVLGTVRYMSPEQARGQTKLIGTAADVYGLGAVLYELLTGEPPFAGESDLEVMRKIEQESPSTVRLRVRKIPRDLETICLKCLEKDPQARYASAGELSRELRRFLLGEPIHARRAGAIELTWKWARRRPLAAALAATVILSSLSLFSGLVVYNRRVTDLLHIAEQEREAAQRAARLANQREQEALEAAYVADMHLAFENWTGSAGKETERILTRHVPISGQKDRRDFVWWYLKNLTTESPVLTVHDGGASAVAASQDGKYLATSGSNGQIRLWDAANRELLAHWIGHPKSQVNALAFSPDCTTLASVGDDHPVRRWRLPAGEPLEPLLGSQGWIADVEYSADGQWIATCGSDRIVRVWNTATGKLAGEFAGHKDIIRSVVFGRDDKVFSSSEDGEVRAWDLATWAPDARLADGKFLNPNRLQVLALSMDVSGSCLLGALWVPELRRWQLGQEDFGKLIESPTFPSAPRSLAVDAENLIAIGTTDGKVQFSGLELDTSKHFRMRHVHADRVNSIAPIPGSQLFLTASRDGNVSLIARNPALLSSETFQGRTPFRLRWRGNLLVSTCLPHHIYVYDLERKQLLFHSDRQLRCNFADVSPIKGKCAAIQTDETLTIYRITEGDVAWTYSLEGQYNDLAIDASGMYVAATSARDLLLFDLDSGRLVQRLPHPQEISDLDSIAGSSLFCTSSTDGQLRIWNANSGKLDSSFLAQAGGIAQIACSHDGTRIVTRGDGEFRIWRRDDWSLLGVIPQQESPDSFGLVEPGEILVVHSPQGLRLHRVRDGARLLDLRSHHPLGAMAVSPDGTQIVTQEDLFLDFLNGRPDDPLTPSSAPSSSVLPRTPTNHGGTSHSPLIFGGGR